MICLIWFDLIDLIWMIWFIWFEWFDWFWLIDLIYLIWFCQRKVKNLWSSVCFSCPPVWIWGWVLLFVTLEELVSSFLILLGGSCWSENVCVWLWFWPLSFFFRKNWEWEKSERKKKNWEWEKRCQKKEKQRMRMRMRKQANIIIIICQMKNGIFLLLKTYLLKMCWTQFCSTSDIFLLLERMTDQDVLHLLSCPSSFRAYWRPIWFETFGGVWLGWCCLWGQKKSKCR